MRFNRPGAAHTPRSGAESLGGSVDGRLTRRACHISAHKPTGTTFPYPQGGGPRPRLRSWRYQPFQGLLTSTPRRRPSPTSPLLEIPALPEITHVDPNAAALAHVLGRGSTNH